MKIRFNLSRKILLMVFCVLALSVTGIALISITQSQKHLSALAQNDLAHLASMAKEMCQVNSELAQKKVVADMETARALFDQYGGTAVEIRDGQMVVGVGTENEVILNGNYEFVDRIKEMTG